MVAEVQLLKEIAENVDDIRNRLIKLELSMDELDSDLHEIRPEYIEKLKKIEKEGTISGEEFEKKFGVRI